MKYGKSRLFALAAAHGASLLAVPAVLQAQNVAGQLEEVVVTARQREENIQDVPVTITAFTATEIRSAGIARPEDFIALTPGVSVVHTAEAGDMQVSIRGINTGRDVEPNFALVVDGVLQTNPNALNQELGERHADRGAQGPAGRSLRPQRRGWRLHRHDPQARRGTRSGGPRGLRHPEQLRREPVRRRPDQRDRARLDRRLHAQHGRVLRQQFPRLRRLRRHVLGGRLQRPAAVRRRRRRDGLQGQVFADRARARSTSMRRWRSSTRQRS